MAPVTPPAANGGLSVTSGFTARRSVRITAYVVAAVALLAVVAWVTTHPAGLATSQTQVIASTPAGEPVYLGVFEASSDFDRTLHVSGVRVFATSTAEVTIVPRVCKRGAVRVTSDPIGFCREIVPTEGATLEGGDQVVLEVSGDVAAVVEIDRVRIAFRDGVQWGTSSAGAPGLVSVLAR